MVIKFDSEPIVPVEQWLSAIAVANKGFGEKVGDILSDLITEDIERTWDTNYSKDVDVFSSDSGAVIVLEWGGPDEAPGKLVHGGDLTAVLPSGIDQSTQVSKTVKAPALIPVYRSIEPERFFRELRPGKSFGQIAPRPLDELLVKEFEKVFKPEIFYRVELRKAGFG